MEDLNFKKKFRFICDKEVIEFTSFSSGYLMKELQQTFLNVGDKINKRKKKKKNMFFEGIAKKPQYNSLRKEVIQVDDCERIVLEVETDREDRTIVHVKNMGELTSNGKWFRKSVGNFIDCNV